MKYFAQYNGNNRSYDRAAGSQGGEDGIIEFLVDALHIDSGVCCEIGAWNGKMFSNTHALVRRGFSCVMVEGAPDRYADLEKTAKELPQITPVELMIADPPDNMEPIFDALGNSNGLCAVLSIDIDGGESAIWLELEKHNFCFALVVIEWSDNGNRHPWTVLNMADFVGYTPITCTNSNLFFVHNDLYSKMSGELAEGEQ